MSTSSNGSTINLSADTATDLSGQVHHLPCCIKFNGPTEVSHYFKPKPTGIQNEGFAVEKSYFRGRELLGANVTFPPQYSGFVIAKNNSGKDGKDEWEAKAKFSNVVLWNHDSLPSKDDTCLRSLHWLTVSDALHKPVTAEDLSGQCGGKMSE